MGEDGKHSTSGRGLDFYRDRAIGAARARQRTVEAEAATATLGESRLAEPSPRLPDLAERLGQFVAPSTRGDSDASVPSSSFDLRNWVDRPSEKGAESLRQRLVGEVLNEESESGAYGGSLFAARMMDQRRRKLGSRGRRA